MIIPQPHIVERTFLNRLKSSSMDFFSAYHEGINSGRYGNAYDEMFEDTATLTPRPHYAALLERVNTLGDDEFRRRVALADATLMNQGITFTVYGDAQGTERTFPVDLIPRIIPADEWKHIERGLTQRIRALNEFLHDLYRSDEPAILRDKVIPREIIESAVHYRRAFIGCNVPHRIHVHICGTDLIRDAAGAWCVLEDNLRTPSGVSYVLENRLILTRVFPQLFASNRSRIRPVDHYCSTLLHNLRALSPRPHPTVVLLTPGVYNSAYFEHAFLAQQMGIELVQGSDLFVENDVVYMRTTRGPQIVDVIYRRIDDDFLDPEVFRKESVLGIRGLMRAYAKGNVALANTVGTGVADDKVVYRYVPEIIRYYLQEDPILPNIPTYCSWIDSERDYMLANLDKLVVKAANESGGYGMLVGPQSTSEQREQFAEKIKADPRNYLAQPLIELSTAPCYKEGIGVVPRRVDLRPYILCGPDSVTIIPGGLTRVALQEGSYVVNSSQGGGSKDTWVLSSSTMRPAQAVSEVPGPDTSAEPLASENGSPDAVLRQVHSGTGGRQ
ncbi:MAG: circularly permuted type 2 ATP-grasp protein [Armatimonadaceae bacterium]